MGKELSGKDQACRRERGGEIVWRDSWTCEALGIRLETQGSGNFLESLG